MEAAHRQDNSEDTERIPSRLEKQGRHGRGTSLFDMQVTRKQGKYEKDGLKQTVRTLGKVGKASEGSIEDH